MKFIVDAQLPKSLSDFLIKNGHDSIHTLDLQLGNATGDDVINSLSDSENRVVVTKDGDFIASHLVLNKPQMLLYVRTGNISNPALLLIFETHLGRICSLFETNSFIEISSDEIIAQE